MGRAALNTLPIWDGQTVVIAASGPSLTEYDVLYVRGRAKFIAINDVYTIAPFADIYYASDAAWWRHHNYLKNRPNLRGQRWTHDHNGSVWPKEAADNGLRVLRGSNGYGLSKDRRIIHFGGNSGFQAINLAVHCGVKRIVLLGFDCMQHSNKSHFFGSHPAPLERASPFALFRQHFKIAATELAEMGVDVINCTRVTSQRCFKQAQLRDVL